MQISKIKKQLEKVKVIYTDVDNTFVTEGCLFKNQKGYTLKNALLISAPAGILARFTPK